jgi:phage terminase Nu1 subunit (DNA packaging protein)
MEETFKEKSLPVFNADNWLSTKELSELLKTSRQSIKNWVDKGLLIARKKGYRNYFHLSDVYEFLNYNNNNKLKK